MFSVVLRVEKDGEGLLMSAGCPIRLRYDPGTWRKMGLFNQVGHMLS